MQSSLGLGMQLIVRRAATEAWTASPRSLIGSHLVLSAQPLRPASSVYRVFPPRLSATGDGGVHGVGGSVFFALGRTLSGAARTSPDRTTAMTAARNTTLHCIQSTSAPSSDCVVRIILLPCFCINAMSADSLHFTWTSAVTEFISIRQSPTVLCTLSAEWNLTFWQQWLVIYRNIFSAPFPMSRILRESSCFLYCLHNCYWNFCTKQLRIKKKNLETVYKICGF